MTLTPEQEKLFKTHCSEWLLICQTSGFDLATACTIELMTDLANARKTIQSMKYYHRKEKTRQALASINKDSGPVS